jgi:hypothetical protein
LSYLIKKVTNTKIPSSYCSASLNKLKTQGEEVKTETEGIKFLAIYSARREKYSGSPAAGPNGATSPPTAEPKEQQSRAGGDEKADEDGR